MFHIYNSILGVQFYSSGASVIMGLHYHIMLDFCEINSVLRVFAFQKVFLEGFLLMAK